METSVSKSAGAGSTTRLKRRFRAADMSLTPRSRVLAVVTNEKPLVPDVCGSDVERATFPAANVGEHRTWRHPPACGYGMLLSLDQRVEFLGIKNFSWLAQVFAVVLWHNCSGCLHGGAQRCDG